MDFGRRHETYAPPPKPSKTIQDELKKYNINTIIDTYRTKYDAIIGTYEGDSPLPVLSTIRTSLLDFMYNKKGKIDKPCTLKNYDDYYYDLSDINRTQLETPIKQKNNVSIEDIFSGKATSRPLFTQINEPTENVRGRGGNTIVFNRELLKIPNWSLKIKDKTGRRSDFFWVLIAKSKYKLAQVPFATRHSRTFAKFDYEKETDKLLKDLIGASFTHAFEKIDNNLNDSESSYHKFYDFFKGFFTKRLTCFITSYYRVVGLLQILKDKKYSTYFTIENIRNFVKTCLDYLDKYAVSSAYRTFDKNIFLYDKKQNLTEYEKKLKHHFKLEKLESLGIGGEGVVFHDDKYVYKYFFNKLKNQDFLKTTSESFKDCKQLYPIEIFNIEDKTVIKYPYEKSEPYEKGFALDFAELISFEKNHGFVFNNIKKENFIIVNGRLKLIDYGVSIIEYSEEEYEKMLKRAFEIQKYSSISDLDFNVIIGMSYAPEANGIDFGYKEFEKLVLKREKEDLHDEKVVKIIEKHHPKKILDYGAGQCKIANTLSDKYSVDVFDIDKETINKRANKIVRIYESAKELPKDNYDLILNNLVLCCVDNNIAENNIIKNITECLKENGNAIISICNPFFNYVSNTELRISGLKEIYSKAQTLKKRLRLKQKIRDEYHRPIEYYINLLQRNGFCIENTYEGEGLNVDTFLPIAEHLILDCKFVKKAVYMDDCSIMIKTNPMEANIIYNQLKHIVCSLEKGIKFFERVVVIDLTKIKNRPRKFAEDNEQKLISEIERAKNNGLIDRIIYANEDKERIKELYLKYFGIPANNSHSTDGQSLYATLYGFDNIKTRYVFQTDSDIMYSVQSYSSFYETFIKMKEKQAVTATIGIVTTSENAEYIVGKRTEVRTCFIDLKAIKEKLPLKNSRKKETLCLTWHKALDKVLTEQESLRFRNKTLWFVHPENNKKNINNLISICKSSIEHGLYSKLQLNSVNLQGEANSWINTTYAEVVIYSRGYNVENEKIKRMLDSLERQTFQDFMLVYVDDASENGSAEYAKFIFENDNRFKNRSIALFNNKNIGALANFIFVMQNVIKNKKAIIINIDNDDCLIDNKAIEYILDRFNNGADLTCGNCIRSDKPWKKYRIHSFEKVWERNGDNIWLHPKCFRRYLFDSIDIETDLKIGGKYVDVNDDFAFMLPMIANAKKCEFIDKELYLFDPSSNNRLSKGKYLPEYEQKIKQELLKRAKTKEGINEKNNRCNRR